MFDRAECTAMGLETFPRVNLAALTVLTALLTEARGNGAAEGLASPNTLDSGAGWISHEENRGDAHATPVQRSSPSSEQNALVLFAAPVVDGAMPVPEWRTLPAAARQALTTLIARLILEHMHGDRQADREEVRSDD